MFFLHRCGRTGRANKVGRAIVMLNDNSQEEDYIEFMEVKGILLSKQDSIPAVKNFHSDFQKSFENICLKIGLDMN